jgi:primosomal protein N' (replication factor Y)
MESFHRARHGMDQLVTLRERVLGRPLPPVQVVDLCAAQRADPGAVFGDLLAASLRERLARGEQAILFINRRGFSAFVLCRDCGFVPRCARCDVSLTLHRTGSGRLLCHYCGFQRRAPERCPRCAGSRVRPFGIGTQRVEAAVQDLLPGARVARLDRDATRRRGSHAQIVEAFRARRFDVLVGTQMVTKGFDFPGVTLVGVVTADVALNTPDFRAAERAFQLLTQVSGRAGRGEQPGAVIVQTFSPGHPSITAAARHDYESFFEAELPCRRELRYPPFGRLARLLASSPEEGAAEGRVRAAAAELRKPAADAGVELLGPAAAPLSRINDRYRWHLVLRGGDPVGLKAALAEALPALQRRAGGVSIDVDPVDLL